jgi:hypothetical protein
MSNLGQSTFVPTTKPHSLSAGVNLPGKLRHSSVSEHSNMGF